MIAELLQRGDLGTNGDVVAKNLHYLGFALDGKAACTGCLETDEQHKVPRIRQSLRQVMQNTSARYHPAGRNDDRGHPVLVDLFRLLGRRREREVWPLQRRSILADHLASVIAV